MQLTPEEESNLANIVSLAAGNIGQAALRAYEEGILMGALRAAQRLGAMQLAQHNSPQGSNTSGDSDDDEADTPITPSDRQALTGLGIDPDKKFRVKNSVFTITGYKPSRWKYPVSASNQNGRKFKFPISAVKGYQGRATR